MKRILISLFISAASLSNGYGQTLKRGIIIDSVQTQIKGQSYALYLPAGYTEEKKHPILFFFEPMARGTLPLNIYKDLAEKYQIILVCSNNSRNYTENRNALDAAEAMLTDVFHRFSIDRDFAITSGFSGGSRVAISVAILTEYITGVIGIGAVRSILLPDAERAPYKKPYAAIVGKVDFNFLEHYDAEISFRKDSIKTLRLVGDHAHQWARPEDFEIAFLWMTGQLKGIGHEGWIQPERVDDYILNLSESVSIADAERIRKNFSEIGLSLKPLSIDEAQIKKEQKKLRQSITKERKLRLQFQDSIRSAIRLSPDKRRNPALSWITSEAGSLIRKSESQPITSAKSQMIKRVLNMLRAVSYETIITSTDSRRYESALVAIEIWSSVSQNRAMEYWFRGRLYASKGDVKEGEKYLNLLIKSGYRNGKSLLRDAAFDSLKETEAYRSLTL